MNLWDILPHPTPEHVVRLFWRKQDKRGNKTRGGDYARNARELSRFIAATVDRDAYLAPNPTRSTAGARHSAIDVTHWSYFLIDVDPLPDMEGKPMEVLGEALKWMSDWTALPLTEQTPMIVDSGRGAQAWVRLNDLLFDDVLTDMPKDGIFVYQGKQISLRRKTARKAQGYWLKRLAEKIGTMHDCRIDTSTSDLPRLMRLPGSYNQKTGRQARIITHGTPYVDLAWRLVTGTPENVYYEPEVVVKSGRTWQAVFSELTRMAQNYLLSGQEAGGRHKVMWHTAKKLAEVGCTKDECRKALTWANGLKGEDEKLDPLEIEHALDTAYGV